MRAHSFFDPFFFSVLVLVAVLTFIDFLLGKEGRRKVKESIGDWWVYLEDATYAGLGADDAAKIQRWFRARLGAIRSFRFWIVGFLLAGVCLAATFLLLSSLYFGESPIAGLPENLLSVFSIFSDRAFLTLANMIMAVISLVMTLGFLRIMASTSSLLLLFLLLIGDIIAAITLIVATITIVQSHRTWDVFDFGNVFDQFIWLSGGVVSLIPTVLHILMAALFMFSKLTAPIMKKPVNLILLRLHESEKGVLSLIGITAGTLAKLAQEGLKLL